MEFRHSVGHVITTSSNKITIVDKIEMCIYVNLYYIKIFVSFIHDEGKPTGPVVAIKGNEFHASPLGLFV